MSTIGRTPRNRGKNPAGTLHVDKPKRAIDANSSFLPSWIMKIFFTGIFLALGWQACSYLDSIHKRWYIFDHTQLHELAQSAIAQHGNDTRAIVDTIVTSLSATHPDYAINKNEEWVFSNAGGAMGAMYVIHASITEYLIIFGTPIGTEGHTGRHAADDYFNILVGEQWAYVPGEFEKEVYSPGSVHHLRRGDAKQYKFHEGGFALELAQGWIPLMLPFGFADSFTSTLDLNILYDTIRISAREMGKNLLNGKI